MRRLVAPCLLSPLLGLYGCGGGDGQRTSGPDGRPASAARAALAADLAGAAIPYDHHILVDQFGYLPDEAKVAVIRDPQAGFDRDDRFTPGTEYELRRLDTGAVVLAGSPIPWHAGAVESSSGDRGWWFDFSAADAPGRYFVFDRTRNRRSAAFAIDRRVYRRVLRDAMRTYFYQRSAAAKSVPFADPCWTDSAAYVGKDQDTQARDVGDRGNAAKVRDLSGGWFDAGDTDKYVTFAAQAVHQLLSAYATNTRAFGDDFGIPESGNGIPDLLDEVRWETDWLKKMQFPDGSFALKVGGIRYVAASPPSADHSERYYVPACTSATIAGAGMMAHAALVFRALPALAVEAQDLQARALRAWQQYAGSPARQTDCDSGVVHAGIADLSAEDQASLAVEASIYLYALTGGARFEDYIAAHYREAHAYHDFGWSRYKADQGEALLFYTTLPGASAPLQKAILADKLADVKAGNRVYGFDPDDDLYRAFLHDEQYHWGSNNPRANYGNTNLEVVRHDLGIGDTSAYRARALGMLHYFHGVNPLGLVYLSNMADAGATASVNSIYHVWFAHGSKWGDARTSVCGPPPGYVTGGPNRMAVKDGVPAEIAPPAGQPPQKSYKDWNAVTPDSSWAVTEPGIYYESAYVRLLSAFVE